MSYDVFVWHRHDNNGNLTSNRKKKGNLESNIHINIEIKVEVELLFKLSTPFKNKIKHEIELRAKRTYINAQPKLHQMTIFAYDVALIGYFIFNQRYNYM